MGTYVITGASSGIGQATATRLTAAGHDVIGVDLAGSTIDADLSTPAGRTAAVAAVRERTQSLSGIVPCAGIAGLPGRDAELLVSLNYFGAVEFVEGLQDLLAGVENAAVVMIGSNSITMLASALDDATIDACLSGDESAARAAAAVSGPILAYPSSKAAICRWVRHAAISDAWIRDGVRINAVAPGITETAMLAETRADAAVGDQLDAIPIALGRPADPDEVAAVIEFLLGRDASYVCGSVVFVDGGTDALLDRNRH